MQSLFFHTLTMKSHGATLTKLVKGTHLNVEWELSYSSIKINYIYIRYAPGRGTNKRDKLIALWTLLETTKKKDIQKLQVLGDSKLVIDWAQVKIVIQNTNLATFMREIQQAFQSFEWLTFHHILREINTKEDELSKEAL
jgi:ribonuclease HI